MSGMNKRAKQIREAVEAAGYQCQEITQRKGGHVCVIVANAKGMTRKLFTGASASDFRALKNFRADIKRAFA